MKFKVGDKVRCIDNETIMRIHANEIYEVKQVAPDIILIADDRGIYDWYKSKYFEPVSDTIKISSWSELDGKENDEYSIKMYETVIEIGYCNMPYDNEISVIYTQTAPHDIVISILKLFGFSIEFTSPQKLTKAEYHFVRFIDALYCFEDKEFTRNKKGENISLIFDNSQIVQLDDTSELFEFLGKKPVPISSLLEMDMEE